MLWAEGWRSRVSHLIVLHLSILHFQLHVDGGGHIWGHGYYRSVGSEGMNISSPSFGKYGTFDGFKKKYSQEIRHEVGVVGRWGDGLLRTVALAYK